MFRLTNFFLLVFLFQISSQCSEILWLANTPVNADYYPISVKTQNFQQQLFIHSANNIENRTILPSNSNDKYHTLWLKSGPSPSEDYVQIELKKENQIICSTNQNIKFESFLDNLTLNSISFLFSINSRSQGKTQLFVDCTGILQPTGECRVKLDVFDKTEKYCEYINNYQILNWDNFRSKLPQGLNQIQSWRMVNQQSSCEDSSGFMFYVKIDDSNGNRNTFDLTHMVTPENCDRIDSISRDLPSINEMMKNYGELFCSLIGLKECEFSNPLGNEILITEKCPKSYNTLLLGFAIFTVFVLSIFFMFLLIVGAILIRDKFRKEKRKEIINHTLIDFDDEEISELEL
jgi:hypothetical protein